MIYFIHEYENGAWNYCISSPVWWPIAMHQPLRTLFGQTIDEIWYSFFGFGCSACATFAVQITSDSKRSPLFGRLYFWTENRHEFKNQTQMWQKSNGKRLKKSQNQHQKGWIIESVVCEYGFLFRVARTLYIRIDKDTFFIGISVMTYRFQLINRSSPIFK